MRLLLTLAITLFLATGCNLVYKQNIQQGNAIEQEDLDKLRIGMTRNQVAFLLGTPAIRDPFHHDRWDYVSTFSRRGEDAVMRKVTLYFENGLLSEMIGVEGDEFVFEEEPPESDEAEEATETPAEATEDTPAEVTPLAKPIAEDAPFQEQAPASDGPTEDAPQAEVQASETPAPVTELRAEPELDAPAAMLDPMPAEFDAWTIQLGAFDSNENANGLLERLQAAGFDAEIREQPTATSGVRYLVRQYGIESRAEAERLLEEIASGLGIDGFLVPPGN